MEDRRDKGEDLFKVRGYLGCLSEGMKLPTRHIILLLKFLWPSLVLSAIVAGLCGVFFNRLSVVFATWLAAEEPVVLYFPLFTLIILCLLVLLTGSLYIGQVMVVISRFADTGVWPLLRLRDSRAEICDAFLRALTFMFVGLVVSGLVLVPVMLWRGLTDVWFTVACCLVLLFFWVPYCMVGGEHLLGRRDFGSALSRFKEGYQYWGAFFIVLFCGGLIMMVLAAVSWLPAAVLAYAGHLSMMGTMAGDVSDLPASVPVCVVFFFMLASVIANVTGWLTLFPLSYLYGSIETRKKEKAEIEAEGHQLEAI